MNNTKELLEIKDRIISTLEDTIKTYEEIRANDKPLKKANEMVELSYKAVIKEQKKVIVILSFALLVSIVLNFII
jgi:hypothetical protein